MAIRRAAESSMLALDLPIGKATQMEAESALSLLQLFRRMQVPLIAECYDLAAFAVQNIEFNRPDLLRISDTEGNLRVMEIAAGLILFFDETIGQAPVIYLEAKERPVQPHLYLAEQYLDEWSAPLLYHQALMAQGGQLIFQPEEVKARRLAEMQGEGEVLPELNSYITKGIALCIHVAPRQFSFRYPEYAISQIARWSIDDLAEELGDIMAMLRREK